MYQGLDFYRNTLPPAPQPKHLKICRCGFTVKEGQTDLKPYVYDAAYALLDAQKDPS